MGALSRKHHINFMGKRWLAFVFSIILVLSSIALPFVQGLNFGIDFSGGIVIEIRTSESADLAVMRNALGNKNLGEVALQHFGADQDVMIRVQSPEGNAEGQAKIIETIKQTLAESFPSIDIDYRKVDYVGAQVGSELIKAGALAMLLAFAAIMMYIWIRFEWQFGVGALVALVHDAVLTVGFFNVLGLEFNLTSVAAILTIIGYSINDSVVIYDRIRENLRKYKKMELAELINISLNETLSRTIITAGTTLVAILALVIWGGEVIHSFSLAMFFGVVIGTYSSIYIAAPLLIYMKLKEMVVAKGNGDIATNSAG